MDMKYLLNTINTNDFFNQYWGCNFLKFRGGDNFFSHFKKLDILKTIHTIEDAIPLTTFLNQEKTEKMPRYNNAIPVDDYLKNGYTMRVRHLNKLYPDMAVLFEQMEKLFCGNASMNFYASRYPAKGISPHYDVHHIFALQIAGKKEWKVSLTQNFQPRWDFSPAIKTAQTIDYESIILHEGDILYIPPGFIHKTETMSSSEHISFAIRMPDTTDLIHTALNDLITKNTVFRTELPISVIDGTIAPKKISKSFLTNIVAALSLELENYTE